MSEDPQETMEFDNDLPIPLARQLSNDMKTRAVGGKADGGLTEALDNSRRVLEIEPQNKRALAVLGIALVRQEQWQEAYKALEVAQKSTTGPGTEDVDNSQMMVVLSLHTELCLRHMEAAELVQRLPAQLEACGFKNRGAYFEHSDPQVIFGFQPCTLAYESVIAAIKAGKKSLSPPWRRGESIFASANALGEQGDTDLAELLALKLGEGEFGPVNVPEDLCMALLKNVQDMIFHAGTNADAEEDDEESSDNAGDEALCPGGWEARCRAKLPGIDEQSQLIWPDGKMKINRDRELLVYTWGDKLMKVTAVKTCKPPSQLDVNAKPLNGRGGGADLKQNALRDDRIVLNVASSLAEGDGARLLRNLLRRIEEDDLHCISVFCSKGRHRSVSLALLLQLYYPHRQLKHLTIK